MGRAATMELAPGRQAMKGIIVAGRMGARLFPAKLRESKPVSPDYHKPMIYYPLGVLLMSGIKEVLISSPARCLLQFRRLLGDGSACGISISFATRNEADGTAVALAAARHFIGDERVAVIHGDSIFYGPGLLGICQQAAQTPAGATIFACRVGNARGHTVVRFDPDTMRPVAIIDHPDEDREGWAVTGLAFYDGDVVDIAVDLMRRSSGGIPMSTIQRIYLQQQRLGACRLGRGLAWLDAGTPDRFQDASFFVRAIETRQGCRIMCPEEIALDMGYVTPDEVLSRARRLGDNDYTAYLRRRVEERACSLASLN